MSQFNCPFQETDQKTTVINIDNAGCRRRSIQLWDKYTQNEKGDIKASAKDDQKEIATQAPYIETWNPPRARNLVLAPHSASPAPQIERCYWWEIDDAGKIQFSTNESVAGDIGAPPVGDCLSRCPKRVNCNSTCPTQESFVQMQRSLLDICAF